MQFLIHSMIIYVNNPLITSIESNEIGFSASFWVLYLIHIRCVNFEWYIYSKAKTVLKTNKSAISRIKFLV